MANKLVKLGAPWCQSCKQLDKNLAGIEHEAKDISKDMEAAKKFAPRSLPTMILLDENDQEIKRHVGLMSAPDIQQWMI
jgi:thioredoxin-like negative regulator of GroEL